MFPLEQEPAADRDPRALFLFSNIAGASYFLHIPLLIFCHILGAEEKEDIREDIKENIEGRYRRKISKKDIEDNKVKKIKKNKKAYRKNQERIKKRGSGKEWFSDGKTDGRNRRNDLRRLRQAD